MRSSRVEARPKSGVYTADSAGLSRAIACPSRATERLSRETAGLPWPAGWWKCNGWQAGWLAGWLAGWQKRTIWPADGRALHCTDWSAGRNALAGWLAGCYEHTIGSLAEMHLLTRVNPQGSQPAGRIRVAARRNPPADRPAPPHGGSNAPPQAGSNAPPRARRGAHSRTGQQDHATWCKGGRLRAGGPGGNEPAGWPGGTQRQAVAETHQMAGWQQGTGWLIGIELTGWQECLTEVSE